MPSPEMRKPRPTGDRDTAQKKTNARHCSLFREVISIAIVGVLLAVLMVDSIVGMSSGFAPSSEVVLMTAGVGDDGR